MPSIHTITLLKLAWVTRALHAVRPARGLPPAQRTTGWVWDIGKARHQNMRGKCAIAWHAGVLEIIYRTLGFLKTGLDSA